MGNYPQSSQVFVHVCYIFSFFNKYCTFLAMVHHRYKEVKNTMTKLIGIERYYGQFNNKENGEIVNYDGYKLHLATDEKKPRGQEIITGLLTDSIKMKKDMAERFTIPYLQSLVGKSILIIFDRYGNIADITETK